MSKFVEFPLSIILIKNSNYAANNLRKRILEEKLLINECSICKLNSLWNDKILVYQLDHINGNPKDNRINNLRMLCPNCHTQTINYAGKNHK